ncbi:UDP-N-acetylglucosamine--N-acetylmuramyl-(pentapeptide) pyrophosphoryl-undecaprenol N-acetylglucosamine transferase [Tepidanaerobacter acetatoxydans Re1]|uniref:UDP-N-acetylglucosamine--N-acetylmuramyl-(pentapeptide) pyrophosphoryl-undecaprenol N-acetylglucosamine transferase n=1 Tax=Tepidanaerobacter acetatoxydans (strain DSM 21804 / JCM 16047 / Re1) TaxID=1209989 RepID=F4LT17_TEPAE|nr:undecaprenyldiphospho-muramoylpentapeptide beta-N-acetylglucosaminyltransferase [Tepidanaerobacter acetatoxydans]AEE91286.1 UDP-N-acetylglucosamine--N-acetylmuramyl-(pentapeptide) pyrophosphoryl-undecaprenol N-acetylglucosamine transferase [Tepidanaerobacter acetatoxydans Re1]CCP25972.1 UDP-N-acetylglucosamine--N-acetylmuramyl-(pentapeptide) pyrophosphoryl-undecaprenol N-acetylglucosamine transferase [Tepidanaerobacter acetatoxydans Re1]
MPPKKNKKIILAGGGTGGHIYPAIAIATGLKQEFPDSDILFIGTNKGLEKELVKKAGFSLKTIRVKGFQRKLSFDTIISVKELALSAIDSVNIIKKEKPDIVIGTGGYVAGPVVFFASLMGVHTAIHEQNVTPGITNRILSKFVEKVFISFPDSLKYFPKNKTVLTGNPVRNEITKSIRSQALKKFGLLLNIPTVLCFGGSQGAARLNDAILYIINEIKDTKRFQLIHITGINHYEKTIDLLANKGIDLSKLGHIIIRPYIHEMQDAYAVADLVISRAGALSISELNACGKPAILIPLPTAANRHQDFNAKFMEENGAAIVISEASLSGEKLLDTISNIIFDQKRLHQMAAASKNLAREDALEKILAEIVKLVK